MTIDSKMSSFSAERHIEMCGMGTQVCIGRGFLGAIGDRCKALEDFSGALVVTDENLADRYAKLVRNSLTEAGIPCGIHVVPPGDASKSLSELERIFQSLGECGVARDGLVVAVGGGMITDLAGFAAATWMRGVASVYCPTTLEADIDASIGGKTGVNHAMGKNLIGAFHQPRAVFIDVACLDTLGDRDLIAGMAESIKHAAITNESFISWHEANASAVLGREEAALTMLIDRNIAIKADIVARDEHETTGVRAMLNFGHTIGHAIEAVSEYGLRHGECVSLGMVAACRLSQTLGMLKAADADRIIRLLTTYGLPTELTKGINREAVWDLLSRDKKVSRGEVRFVLLEGIGNPVLKSGLPEGPVREAIASL